MFYEAPTLYGCVVLRYCISSRGCHFRFIVMSGSSDTEILIAAIVPSVVFVIVLVAVIVVGCRFRRCSSQDIDRNFGEVSDVSVPVRLYRRIKRRTAANSNVLHTPPMYKRTAVWATSNSRYAITHVKPNDVVAQRLTGMSGHHELSPPFLREGTPEYRHSSYYIQNGNSDMYSAASTGNRNSRHTYI